MGNEIYHIDKWAKSIYKNAIALLCTPALIKLIMIKAILFSLEALNIKNIIHTFTKGPCESTLITMVCHSLIYFLNNMIFCMYSKSLESHK